MRLSTTIHSDTLEEPRRTPLVLQASRDRLSILQERLAPHSTNSLQAEEPDEVRLSLPSGNRTSRVPRARRKKRDRCRLCGGWSYHPGRVQDRAAEAKFRQDFRRVGSGTGQTSRSDRVRHPAYRE